MRDRVAGFREALGRFPNIRIVAAPAVERGLRLEAKQKMDNVLSTGQRIDAVFGTNDDCALGALAGLLTGSNTVGFVGGMEIPLIKKFEAGYRAGVRAVSWPMTDRMNHV